MPAGGREGTTSEKLFPDRIFREEVPLLVNPYPVDFVGIFREISRWSAAPAAADGKVELQVELLVKRPDELVYRIRCRIWSIEILHPIDKAADIPVSPLHSVAMPVIRKTHLS